MLLLGKIFLHKNGEKCCLSDLIFIHKNGEKSGENGEKSGIFSPKNAGTWRSNRVVPDVPADYVGRPTRLGKLVELL
jgi:hypothetical protein